MCSPLNLISLIGRLQLLVICCFLSFASMTPSRSAVDWRKTPSFTESFAARSFLLLLRQLSIKCGLSSLRMTQWQREVRSSCWRFMQKCGFCESSRFFVMMKSASMGWRNVYSSLKTYSSWAEFCFEIFAFTWFPIPQWICGNNHIHLRFHFLLPFGSPFFRVWIRLTLSLSSLSKWMFILLSPDSVQTIRTLSNAISTLCLEESAPA